MERLEERTVLDGVWIVEEPYPGPQANFEVALYEDRLGDGLSSDDSLLPGASSRLHFGDGRTIAIVGNLEHTAVRTECFQFTTVQHEWQVESADRFYQEGIEPIDVAHYAPDGTVIAPANMLDFSSGRWVMTSYEEALQVSFSQRWDEDNHPFCGQVYSESVPATHPGIERTHYYQKECYQPETVSAKVWAFHRPTVSGQVFFDFNADGVRDPEGAESTPLAGVTVFQDVLPNNQFDGVGVEPFAVTDAAGRYALLAMPAPEGSSILVQLEPQYPYTTRTTPVVPVVPRSGEDLQQDIGVAYLVGAIGTVFRDTDGDGWQNPEEPGLAGVVVFWDRTKDGYLQVRKEDGRVDTLRASSELYAGLCDLAGEPCAVSGEDGSFVVEGYIDAHGVLRLDDGGWPGDTLRVLTPHYWSLHTVTQHELYAVPPITTLEDYRNVLGVQVGIFDNVDVEGRVTWDINGDGQPDGTPIPNVKVYLDAFDDGSMDYEATTNADGRYRFANVEAGRHTVHLGVKSESMVTYPSHPGHPDAHFYFVRPVSGQDIGNLDFGAASGAEFTDRAVTPDDRRDSPELQAQKKQLQKAILDKILAQTADDYGNWQRLHLLANRLIDQQVPDGYIPVSLDTLRKIEQLVDVQIQVYEARNWWSDFAKGAQDLFQKDLDRLMAVWDKTCRTIGALWTDKALQSRILTGLAEGPGRLADYLATSLDALWVDLRRDWRAIVWDTAVGMGNDLQKVETYKRIMWDLMAFEQFENALDPDVPVDARIGNFLFGYLTWVDLVLTGKSLAPQVAARAKTIANKLAYELYDDPNLAKAFSARLLAKMDAAAKGQKVTLKSLAYGEEISASLLEELGYTGPQLRALQDIAKNNNYHLRFRTTNPKSAQFIREGTALPKPLDIKAKTINNLDVELGYDAAHEGLVGMKHPDGLLHPSKTPSCLANNKERCAALKARFNIRVEDFEKLFPKLDKTKYRIASDGRVFSIEKGKAITGDIDPVGFVKPNGEFVTGDEYVQLVERLGASKAHIEHGAETNFVDDVMRMLAKDCQQGNPKCIPAGTAQWQEAIEEARRSRAKLVSNHQHEVDVTVEFHPDGKITKERITDLPTVTYEGWVTGSFSLDTANLDRMLRETGTDILSHFMERRTASDALEGLLQLFDERRQVKAGTVEQMLRADQPDVGISPQQFQDISPEQLRELIDSEPGGLNIEPAGDTSDGEGEGASAQPEVLRRTEFGGSLERPADHGLGEGEEPALTAAAIWEKLRLAVSHAEEPLYQVLAKDNGGFVVRSRLALVKSFDVNGDGYATPLDVLLNINSINQYGSRELPRWPTWSDFRPDVDRDGWLLPLDILLTINFLNSSWPPAGEGEAWDGAPREPGFEARRGLSAPGPLAQRPEAGDGPGTGRETVKPAWPPAGDAYFAALGAPSVPRVAGGPRRLARPAPDFEEDRLEFSWLFSVPFWKTER